MMYKFLRKIHIPFISFCTLFSLEFFGRNAFEQREIQGIRSVIAALRDTLKNREGFAAALVFLFIYLFYRRYNSTHDRPSKKAYVFASIFAFIDIIGRNFFRNGGLSYYASSAWFPVLMSLICFLGIISLGSRLYELFSEFLISHSAVRSAPGKLLDWFFSGHPFLCPAVFIFLCWIPYFIGYYPGLLQVDAAAALAQYYGPAQWTTHQPPLGVWIMGKVMDIGKMAGSEKLGCTLYVYPQALILVLTLAYLFIFLERWKTPYWFRILVCLFDSFFPFFPAYALLEIKDTLYYIACLWLFYAVISWMDSNNRAVDPDKRDPQPGPVIRLLTAVFFFCLLRNEAVFIALLLPLAGVIFYKKINKQHVLYFSLTVFAGVVLASVFQWGMCRYFDITKGNIREILTIPIQQNARYVHYRGHELSEEEWRDLKILYTDPQLLDAYYDPDFVDTTKWILKADVEDHMDIFRKVWLGQFRKAPVLYIEAAISQMYGYFFIDKPDFHGNLYSSVGTEYIYYGDQTGYTPNQLNKLIDESYDLFRNFPVIKLLTHPAFYTWLILFLLFFMQGIHDPEKLLIFALPLGTIITCCLSPVNAAMRYDMPVVLYSVIIFAYALRTNQLSADQR